MSSTRFKSEFLELWHEGSSISRDICLHSIAATDLLCQSWGCFILLLFVPCFAQCGTVRSTILLILSCAVRTIGTVEWSAYPRSYNTNGGSATCAGSRLFCRLPSAVRAVDIAVDERFPQECFPQLNRSGARSPREQNSAWWHVHTHLSDVL